jgi:hypothetical protein
MATYPATISQLPAIFNPSEFYKPETGVGTLQEVLTEGNDANNLDIVNGGAFGCDALSTPFGYIDALDASVLGDIATLGLSINPNGTLKIKGATAKGSLLVGDGTNTTQLPTSTDGLVLKTNSGTASGLEWGSGGGGGVSSITAGLNIGVDATIASAPVVRVLNPLTSTLNLGTQHIDGTTGYINFVASATSEAQMSALLGFTSYDAIAPTTQTSLYKTGLTTSTSGNQIVVAPTSITKNLGVAPLAITSTTSPITLTPLATNDCNVVVSGAGKLHAIQSSSGGASQPICVLENTNADATAPHLDFYKNSASPANDDIVGAVSFHAKNASATSVEFGRISVVERDITAGSENGSLSLFVCENSATPTEYLRANGILGSNDLYKPIDTRGNAIKNTTAGQQLTLLQTASSQPITLNNSGGGGITNTCSSGQYSVSSNNFSITGSAGGILTTSSGNLTLSTGSTGVVIVSQNGATTNKLRTDIANINYYPEFIVDNANSNAVSVPPAQVYGEKLILVNKGVSPLVNWNTYGNGQGSVGVLAMYACSNGEVYVSRADDSTIYIYDSSLTNVNGSFQVAGSGSLRVYCFYEESGYMFVGGSFTSVNGNATPQINLTRINISTKLEEPLEGSGANGFGNYGVGKVNTLTGYGGELIVGGDFTQIGGSSATCNYLGKVYNQSGSSGSQNFYEVGNGVNARVYALNNTNGYLFVGGDFTYVNNGMDNYTYLATWNGSSWGYVGGGYTTFNSSITTITSTPFYPYLFVGGSFSAPYTYGCYIDWSNPSGSNATDSGKSWSYPFVNNAQGFYNGASYILTLDSVSQNTAYQTWVSLGTPPTGYTPSFIGNFNGELKVAYDNSTIVYSKTLASQTCAFSLSSGNFKYNGTLYTTYTLSLIDVAMEFLGDTTSSPAYWRPIGYAYAGGSFS